MSDEWNLGIELIPRVDDSVMDSTESITGFADASRDGERESRMARTRTALVLKTKEAVEQVAEDVGKQIGVMAKQAVVGLESIPLDGMSYATSQVQLTFSIKLTGGLGKLTEAFIVAGGEAQIQVAVTLTRT